MRAGRGREELAELPNPPEGRKFPEKGRGWVGHRALPPAREALAGAAAQ